MIEKFIFVEDGSVDVEELEDRVGDTVKVIVYRQGSSIPQIAELQTPISDSMHDMALTVLNRVGKDILDMIEKDTTKEDMVESLKAMYESYFMGDNAQ